MFLPTGRLSLPRHAAHLRPVFMIFLRRDFSHAGEFALNTLLSIFLGFNSSFNVVWCVSLDSQKDRGLVFPPPTMCEPCAVNVYPSYKAAVLRFLDLTPAPYKRQLSRTSWISTSKTASVGFFLILAHH